MTKCVKYTTLVVIMLTLIIKRISHLFIVSMCLNCEFIHVTLKLSLRIYQLLVDDALLVSFIFGYAKP